MGGEGGGVQEGLDQLVVWNQIMSGQSSSRDDAEIKGRGEGERLLS